MIVVMPDFNIKSKTHEGVSSFICIHNKYVYVQAKNALSMNAIQFSLFRQRVREIIGLLFRAVSVHISVFLIDSTRANIQLVPSRCGIGWANVAVLCEIGCGVRGGECGPAGAGHTAGASHTTMRSVGW